MFGMFGGMGLASVLLYYKPDTRCVHRLPAGLSRSCRRIL
jgi:hypothetical protein